MTQLPKPSAIVYCRRCHDVMIAKHDRSGWYCSKCAHAISPVLA